MFGFLNVNKPARMTSRDVVNVIQRYVRPDKIGHAGTLDPLATGVLVIGIGYATRLFPYLQRLPKRYRATFQFGVRSDTDDLEGRIEEVGGEPIALEEVERQLAAWRGEVQQIPPAYSAAKLGGRRAYELARRGEQPELAARTVRIDALDVTSFQYPHIELDIQCSAGTYIRSLGRDLAAGLGTCAVMTNLNRTAVGPFFLYDSIPLERISADSLGDQLQSPLTALPNLPQFSVSSSQLADVLQGRSIQVTGAPAAAVEAAAVDELGALVAILTRISGDQWRPERCFGRPAAGPG